MSWGFLPLAAGLPSTSQLGILLGYDLFRRGACGTAETYTRTRVLLLLMLLGLALTIVLIAVVRVPLPELR